MNDFSFKLPSGWKALDDSQRRYVFRLLTRELPWIGVQTLCLLKWGGIRILSTPGTGEDGLYHISVKSEREKSGELATVGRRLHLTVTAEEMHGLVRSLDWLREMPAVPCPPCRVRGRRVMPAMLDGVDFETFIVIDNRLQGWITGGRIEQLEALKDLLFPPGRLLRLWRRLPGRRRADKPDWLGLAALQWGAALKTALARLYPHFLKPARPGSGPRLSAGITPDSVGKAVDAQLRALTKGDITKEEAVRRMPYRRALTELDALARESEELRLRK